MITILLAKAINLEELKVLNLGKEKDVKLEVSHARLRVLEIGREACFDREDKTKAFHISIS